MKNAILVHGWVTLDEFSNPNRPTPSNSHWLPWLSKQLMLRDIHTVAVEMPKADLPVYEDWKCEFVRYDVTPETILVGHSCGAGFLVRYLSENPESTAGTLVLVAPSLGLSWDDRSFFDFKFSDTIADRVDKIVVIYAEDDRQYIQEAVKIYSQKLPTTKLVKLKTGGHLTYKEMGKAEFPELLDAIVGQNR